MIVRRGRGRLFLQPRHQEHQESPRKMQCVTPSLNTFGVGDFSLRYIRCIFEETPPLLSTPSEFNVDNPE